MTTWLPTPRRPVPAATSKILIRFLSSIVGNSFLSFSATKNRALNPTFALDNSFNLSTWLIYSIKEAYNVIVVLKKDLVFEFFSKKMNMNCLQFQPRYRNKKETRLRWCPYCKQHVPIFESRPLCRPLWFHKFFLIYFQVVRGFLEKLEQVSENPELKEEMEREVTRYEQK